jgi:hypothetical protein
VPFSSILPKISFFLFYFLGAETLENLRNLGRLGLRIGGERKPWSALLGVKGVLSFSLFLVSEFRD